MGIIDLTPEIFVQTFLTVLFLFYILFILFLIRGIFSIKPRLCANNLKVSVIVPFRNEENNLRRCVLSILNQKFDRDRFEIILVDDNSEDKSVEAIKDLIEKENIKLIKLDNGYGKKRAIEAAINHSVNEIIVTTDADCFHSKYWLKSLIESFDDRTGFVAGKVVYSETRNVFEEFQKIEFASLVSIGSAFIGNKLPLLANGASCAYRKDLFYQVGGFKDNISLASGDEEFLMQKIFFDTDYEVKFCAAKESVTYTEPIHSATKFINQRKRWVSKVPFYRNKLLLPVLSLLYLFYLLLFVTIFYSLFNSNMQETLLYIFLSKMIFDLVFMIKAYHFLELSKHKFELLKLIMLFPLAEIFHLIYITIVPILSYMTGFNWKERNFRR